MTVRARITTSPSSTDIAELFFANYRIVAAAATAATHAAGEEAKDAARRDMGAAGFSVRFQNALRGYAYPKGGTVSASPTYNLVHNASYSNVFETGAVIAGKPFLWLPLGGANAPRTIGGRKIRPSDLGGRLVTIKRKGGGPPLLGAPITLARSEKSKTRFSAAELRRARTATVGRARKGAGGTVTKIVPLFFGIRTVTIPKKFSIEAVAKQYAASIPGRFASYFQDRS